MKHERKEKGDGNTGIGKQETLPVGSNRLSGFFLG